MEEPDSDRVSKALPSTILDQTTFLLAKVGMEAKRRMCEEMAGKGLKIGHHGIMACLDEFGPMTQKDLGDRLYFDASDVAGYLDELEAFQLVERRKDDVDRRRKVVSLTPSGHEMLTDTQRASKGIATALLSPLDTSEQAHLKQMLRRVFNSYDPRG